MGNHKKPTDANPGTILGLSFVGARLECLPLRQNRPRMCERESGKGKLGGTKNGRRKTWCTIWCTPQSKTVVIYHTWRTRETLMAGA